MVINAIVMNKYIDDLLKIYWHDLCDELDKKRTGTEIDRVVKKAEIHPGEKF